MISTAVLIVMWRRARDVFWWILPITTGLIISTVYCRFHYVVDLIAGAALAFLFVPLGDRLYDALMRESSPLFRGRTGRPSSAFS